MSATTSVMSDEESGSGDGSIDNQSSSDEFGGDDSSRDQSVYGSLGEEEDADSTELELAMANDRRRRRAARQAAITARKNGESDSTCLADSSRVTPLSRFCSSLDYQSRRPQHLPGLSFTGEELWQLRKAFDIFAAKYRRSGQCRLTRRAAARTPLERACVTARPNAPEAKRFTLESFEMEASISKQKYQPLLTGEVQMDSPSASSSPSSSTSPSATVDVDDPDQDLIRISDYAHCFSSWTGLTSCEESLNVHLFWSCSKVSHDTRHPCVTFTQFMQGFADYCFADRVPSQLCADPRVRRKRLFRSLTAEVFESLKSDAHQRTKFHPIVTLQEFVCLMLPPLFLIRSTWTTNPIPLMPPFTSQSVYLFAISLLWILATIFPILLPSFDPQYEVYTASSRLCEVETYGLLAIYTFLALYWCVMVGSQYSDNAWETSLKRDLDWLSLCRVRSPLGCVTRMRSAKDVFEQIFSEVYLNTPTITSAVLRPNGGGAATTTTTTNGNGSTTVGGVPMNAHSMFRKNELSKVTFSRCLFWLGLSFLFSFPVAFLPTLYRATIVNVDLLPPRGETIPILIVVNFMITSIATTMLLVHLNFVAFQRFRDFSNTLRRFNKLFCLTRTNGEYHQGTEVFRDVRLGGGPTYDDTPYLPLHNPLNVRSWSMMRRYLLEVHMEELIRFLENIYGILFFSVLGGVVFVVVREVISHRTYASSLLVLYLAMLFAIQLMCMIFSGVTINESQSAHVSLLCEQSWSITRVLLSFPTKCEGSEVMRLRKTEHLLSQLAQAIRHSRTVLSIWGIPLQANVRNAVLTVTFSALSSVASYLFRSS